MQIPKVLSSVSASISDQMLWTALSGWKAIRLNPLLRWTICSASMTGDGSLRPAAGISLQGFLNHFIVRKSHEDEDDAQHVVIIHGEGIRFPGTTIPDNVYITRIPNKEMWLNILYTWTMALGRESSGYRIYNSIHEYVDHLTFSSKSFAWFGKEPGRRACSKRRYRSDRLSECPSW